MKTIKFRQFTSLIRKEFYHVFRDKKTMLILFGMPATMILIFGFALTNEIRNTSIVVIDQANDNHSKKLTQKISTSNYFTIVDKQSDPRRKNIEQYFQKGSIKLALIIPNNFSSEIESHNTCKIQIIADATDPNNANVLTSYITSIIRNYERQISGIPNSNCNIIPEIKMLYNPKLKGAPNFVPGVIALVLMLICVMMTAISIVREKEMGTMEVLLVSPFRPFLIILSKTVPYLLISLLNIILILLLSVFVLHLPIKGNLTFLFIESALFIITCLTLGIFISIKAKSQQAAMLISLVGMFLPTVLFSGFMFPIDNMPLILQFISNLVPAKWFYTIAKSIMIQGSHFSALWTETLILTAMTVLLMVASLKNFKVRLEP